MANLLVWTSLSYLPVFCTLLHLTVLLIFCQSSRHLFIGISSQQREVNSVVMPTLKLWVRHTQFHQSNSLYACCKLSLSLPTGIFPSQRHLLRWNATITLPYSSTCTSFYTWVNSTNWIPSKQQSIGDEKPDWTSISGTCIWLPWSSFLCK